MKDYEKIEKRTEEILKIFEDTESDIRDKGDNAFLGLQILSKYSKSLIEGADHDIIYSISLETAIEAGITDEDVTSLAILNWMLYDDEYFACYV